MSTEILGGLSEQVRGAAADQRDVVVMVHEVFGIDDAMRAQMTRLAQAGYVVVMPDLFSRGGAAASVQGAANAEAYRAAAAESRAALIQAERYGTPVSQALRVMAKENRDLRLAEAEKKAASLPPKLTVPMIVFFLPVLFVVILGPAISQAVKNFF